MNDFETLCFYIWGKHWKVEAAKYLDKDEKNIYQYKKGIIKPKKETLQTLYLRLVQQWHELDNVITRMSKYAPYNVNKENNG